MVAQKKAKVIQDETWVKEHQKPLPLDEYELQPDEITIEQFAEKASVSTRAVQKWLTARLISYELKNKRNPKDGAIREIRIFKTADVDEFLNNRSKGKLSPKLDKVMREEPTNNNEHSQVPMFSPDAAFGFLEKLAAQLQPKQSVLTQLSNKIFIGLDELALYSGIAKARLEPAIKQALEKGTLQHFTGERGKSVYKCVELDLIIENLPPTPKQLPPTPPPIKKKKK